MWEELAVYKNCRSPAAAGGMEPLFTKLASSEWFSHPLLYLFQWMISMISIDAYNTLEY